MFMFITIVRTTVVCVYADTQIFRVHLNIIILLQVISFSSNLKQCVRQC